MLRLLLMTSVVFSILFGTRPATADSLVDTLDQVCGKVVDNLGCTDLATGYPEALGATVGALVAAKGQFANKEDCGQKLQSTSKVLAQIQKQIDVPGLPFEKLGQCSCSIVFAGGTCSSAVTEYAQQVSDVVKGFFCSIGICDEHQAPPNPEQEKARYYQANYVPHLGELQDADYPVVHDTLMQLTRQCNDDWYYSNLFYDPTVEVCSPLYQQFMSELTARQKVEQDAKNAELQKQADLLQQQKDPATDNARKIAMNWAQIKLKQYGSQCFDKQCTNEIGVIAFAYYGAIATGMQKLDASNTTALLNANAQFEPLFKQKVAEGSKRKSAASGHIRHFELSPSAMKLEAALATTKAQLMKLGIIHPDILLARARKTYIRHASHSVTIVKRPLATP